MTLKCKIASVAFLAAAAEADEPILLPNPGASATTIRKSATLVCHPSVRVISRSSTFLKF
jgi:hypothetical protein